MPSLGTCPACQRGLDLEGRCLCDSRRRDGVTFRLDVVGGDVVRLDRHGDRPLYKREDNEDDGDLDGDPPWIA